MIAASIRQQAAQSIYRALRFWYSRQSVARLRSASLIEQRKQHLYATYVQSKLDLIYKRRYRAVGSEPSDPPKVPKGYFTAFPFTDINVRAATDNGVQEAINNESRRLIITVDEAKEVWKRERWAEHKQNGVALGVIYTASDFFHRPYDDSYDDGLLSHSPFCCGYFTRRNRNMEYSEKLRNRE